MNLSCIQRKHVFYFSIFSLFVLTFIFVTSPHYDRLIIGENLGFIEELTYSDLNGSCPNTTSIVVTVLAGGRLGNQVWEYLSVWAVARNHPGWWPAVPRQILNTLQPLFSPLTIPVIEDLAERCNAPFWIEELKNCPRSGNHGLLKAALRFSKRTRPSLYVLPKYTVQMEEIATHWPDLRLQLPLSPGMQNLSEANLNEIANKIRKAQNLTEDEPLEFVSVHVRRTDYTDYMDRIAESADQEFYLNAMEEMRRQLHPRHCAFVVVSDELDWCRTYLSGAPDVEIAGTGDTKNPYLDLALLSACNHSVFAYGTFGLTSVMQHPLGKTIVYDQAVLSYAPGMHFAKYLNWIRI